MAATRKVEQNTGPVTDEAAGGEPDFAEMVMNTLAELTVRVENLEQHTAAPTPEEAERIQVERDRDLLSRVATSYEEAVAQEAARKRQADRARRPIGDGG